MRLNLKALSLTAGLVWAFAIFVVGLANLFWQGYGDAFLKLMASVYPGYHANRTIGDFVVGILYGFFDGMICAFIFGWLYNRMAGEKRS